MDIGTDCEQYGIAAAAVAEIGGADVSSGRITEIREASGIMVEA